MNPVARLIIQMEFVVIKKNPSDHCSLQVQSSSSIDKDSRGFGERHNIQLGI